MRRFFVGLLVVVSALCLLISSTSLWTRRNVVNTEVFVGNTQTMIHAPAVQNRVAAAVTAQVIANPDVQDAIDSAMTALPPGLQRFRPTVEDGIRSLVSTGVRRLLSSAAFTAVTTATLTHAHTQLVNGQPVRFTLGQAKDLVPPGSRDGLAGQVLGLVPNNLGITVVTPASAPRLYNAIDLLKTAWLWLGLAALAALAGALAVSHRRRKTLRAWSVTLTVLVLMVLATLRLVHGPLIAAVKPLNRDAVSAIWDVIAGSLRSWNLWLLGIALLVLTGTLVWGRLGVVAGIRRASAAAGEQMRQRREARAVAAIEGQGATVAGGVEGAAVQGAAVEGAAVEGAEPGTVVVPAEPWTRRVAAGTSAFVAGLELERRSARLGSLVWANLRIARWAGIVIGALVLLFWPAPTLRVLIWIAALVAIYLGALEWLQAHAPEAAEERTARAAAVPEPVPPAPVAQVDGRPDGHGVPAGPGSPVPSPRESQEPAERLGDVSERLDLVLRLASARDSGVISEDEFAREKARVLPA